MLPTPVTPAGGRAEPDAAPHLNPALDGLLVVSGGVSAVAIDEYRQLAATLGGWQRATGGNSLMLVSAAHREGRSLTALNLALTLSGASADDVLLIDGDLRHPWLHEAFQVERAPGLSELAEDRPAEPISVGPRLHLLPAGAESVPERVWSSAGVRRLMEHARHSFAWVIVDTPAASAGNDAALVRPFVDGAVLIVAAGRSTAAAARTLIDTIGREVVLGVVMNNVATSDHEPFDGHRRRGEQ
jgi:Mrp family chromosome partitioning ATPase